MSTIWIKCIQLVLSLTILVVFHEFGHFLFSRLFGVRVEKFYAFFNPRFSLVRIKRVNGKIRVKFFAPNVPESYEEVKHYNFDGKEEITYKPVDIDSLPEDDWRRSPENTEFGVGWVPFGGYCKIAGMIDESMDIAAMKQEPKPWEFRTKNAWQRLLIMVGGVLFNLILAFFIYSMVLFKWGDSYIPAQGLKYGMEFNEHAESIGFRDGDVIIATDGKATREFDGDLYRAIAKAKQVTVLRDGQKVDLAMPDDLSLFDFTREESFVTIYAPATVGFVSNEVDGAYKAGIQAGDTILYLNGQEMKTWNEFLISMGVLRNRAKESFVNHDLDIVIGRPGAGRDTLTATASVEDFKIGINHDFSEEYKAVYLDYGFFSSIPAGISYGWNTLKSYVGDFRYVFTKEGAKSLGGFGTIGSIFPERWNWHAFWLMTAFLSIILAFMNILPIPALDGGYVLFLLVEVVTGKKPGDKFLEVANTIGMIILFGLLIYANLNDIMRLF
ncbi:MAG: RIP metalloprotease RseP [Bacteroidaceae bacterium]|nr:RIP metalloprotease RseP [Bacteroidaceae bacterium]